MSQCVILNADGSLTPTTDAPAACAGYVLLTPGEYASSQWTEVLWQKPTDEQVQLAVNYGFYLPLVIFVIASMTGTLANFFNSKHDHN